MFADPVALIVFVLVLLLIVGVVTGRVDFIQALLGILLVLILFAMFGAPFHR